MVGVDFSPRRNDTIELSQEGRPMPDQRQTYFEAVGFFLDVAERIHDDRWEGPGLGTWSVRELVGHTGRALSNVERDLVTPVRPSDGRRENALVTAAGYFATGMATPGIHESVAERGRESGAALGADPIAAIRTLEARIRELLDRTPDDAVVTTPFGALPLPEYLPTKTFELVVHTLDIAAALGLEIEPPAAPLAVTLDLALELSALRADPAERVALLRAITGRAPLPAGFTVL
jgi:uncharacterized protein (TIGR03083 family)